MLEVCLNHHVHVHVHDITKYKVNNQHSACSYLVAHSGVLKSILAVPVRGSTRRTFPPQLSDIRSNRWVSLCAWTYLGRPDTTTTRGRLECYQCVFVYVYVDCVCVCVCALVCAHAHSYQVLHLLFKDNTWNLGQNCMYTVHTYTPILAILSKMFLVIESSQFGLINVLLKGMLLYKQVAPICIQYTKHVQILLLLRFFMINVNHKSWTLQIFAYNYIYNGGHWPQT